MSLALSWRVACRGRVIEFPLDQRSFDNVGHDHPSSLNRAMSQIKGDWVCLMDSDAHPINDQWLPRVEGLLDSYDAVLAQDPLHPGFSHPCFMFFRGEQARRGLLFDVDMYDRGVDSGRLVYKQLTDRGLKVFLAPHADAFGGFWGSLYLDSVYHHGHGTFHAGGKALRGQLNWRNQYYRKKVLGNHRYTLGPLERLFFGADAVVRNVRRRFLHGQAGSLPQPGKW